MYVSSSLPSRHPSTRIISTPLFYSILLSPPHSSALTGEALPIAKTKGDKVLSSGVVQNGYIEVEVTSNPCDSTIRKVNQSVADVQADRSEFAKIVDGFAAYWTPAVLLGALCMALIAGGVSSQWHVWVSE
jgi:Zn2+/Cd2+-exporting ATPase